MQKSSTKYQQIESNNIEKNYTLWLSGIFSSCARLFQHLKISWCNSAGKWFKEEKSHDHTNGCRKGIWQSPKLMDDKNCL